MLEKESSFGDLVKKEVQQIEYFVVERQVDNALFIDLVDGCLREQMYKSLNK